MRGSRGWLRSNPPDKVKPVGQKRHGKPQLTINEARLLYGVYLREAERDDGALGVLLALTMGMRTGEVVSRTMRDLDDGGRLLRVMSNEALGFLPNVSEQTPRFCKVSGIPVVCAHSLRGVASTAPVGAGVEVEAVASLLGHESSRIARQSYTRPGTVEQAERERTQRVLAGSTLSQTLGHGQSQLSPKTRKNPR